jgi:hypothetical protein
LTLRQSGAVTLILPTGVAGGVYGENTWLRDRLDRAGCEYVLSIGPKTKVFEQGIVFAVAPKKPGATRGPVRPRPDRQPDAVGELIGRRAADSAEEVTFRDRPDGEPATSRFILARVHAAHGWRDDDRRSGWREGAEVPPREEWLIAEWPPDQHEPTDYWISNLPADTGPERLHAWHACAGRWSLTTNSSKASWGSTTTKAAPGSDGTTTPRWSLRRTASSLLSG